MWRSTAWDPHSLLVLSVSGGGLGAGVTPALLPFVALHTHITLSFASRDTWG